MKTETLKELFERTKIELIEEWTENDKAKVLKAPNKERAMSIFALEFYDNIRKNDSEFSKYMYKDFLSHCAAFFEGQIIFTEDYEEALENSIPKIKKYLEKESEDVKKVGDDLLNNLSNEEIIRLIAKNIAREDYYKRYKKIHQPEIVKKIDGLSTELSSHKTQINYKIVLTQLAGKNLITSKTSKILIDLLNTEQIYSGKKIDYPDYLWQLYMILCYLLKSNLIKFNDPTEKGIKNYIISNFTYKDSLIIMGGLSEGIKKAKEQAKGGSYSDFINDLKTTFIDLDIKIKKINC